MDAATGDTVLLLEDVSGRQGDSVAGCSLAEAELAITQLAEFQASWWDSPRLDGLEWMPLKDGETGVYEELYAERVEVIHSEGRERDARRLATAG